MSVIKGRISDVSDDMMQRLQSAFPVDNAVYHPDTGQSLEQLAYHAGQASVVKWIMRHANQSTSAK